MDAGILEEVSSAVQQTADYSYNTLGVFCVTTCSEFLPSGGVGAGGQYGRVKVWRRGASFSEKVIFGPHLKGKVGALGKVRASRQKRREELAISGKGDCWQSISVCKRILGKRNQARELKRCVNMRGSHTRLTSGLLVTCKDYGLGERAKRRT